MSTEPTPRRDSAAEHAAKRLEWIRYAINRDSDGDKLGPLAGEVLWLLSRLDAVTAERAGLPEWCCPACGAVTRARIAYWPQPAEDLGRLRDERDRLAAQVAAAQAECARHLAERTQRCDWPGCPSGYDLITSGARVSGWHRDPNLGLLVCPNHPEWEAHHPRGWGTHLNPLPAYMHAGCSCGAATHAEVDGITDSLAMAVQWWRDHAAALDTTQDGDTDHG